MCKKIVCLFLCILLALGTFSSCGQTPQPMAEESAPTASEAVPSEMEALESESSETPAPVPTAADRGLYTQESQMKEITVNGLTCGIDTSTGMLRKISTAEQSLELDGILIDVGVNEANIFKQLSCPTVLGDRNRNYALQTWVLPAVLPRKEPLPPHTVNYIRQTPVGVDVSLLIQSLEIVYHYEFRADGVRLTCELFTTSNEPLEIAGVSFIVRELAMPQESAVFEFPGNTPAGIHKMSDMLGYSIMETNYCNGVTRFNDGSANVNVIFLDNQEKWGCGVYKNENQLPVCVNVAGVESYLSQDEPLEVGQLFLQLPGEKDPYLAVQDYYLECGYKNPDTQVNDGPIYSCHPSGTADTEYSSGKTLQELAEQMESVKAMGFKNIWLLPIFQDTGNVYEAIDQAVISEVYGGEEGAKIFAEKTHALGMRVLYDYVPHGPKPVYPLARDNPDWCSKTKVGTIQEEWDCVSFDYNNPEYLAYTTALVKRQALELGVDGARIDCAMGGLANWNPQPGLRPSSSGIKGGLAIVDAIRNGFIEAGKTPIILPENFHPIPLYAEYTDVFYDMPLFRVMYDLNQSGVSDTEYVATLRQWLDAERKTSIPGQVKLRFLENHDTCHWTFDGARAQVVYGLEKSQAMFAFISFIDGVPYVYQGDEAPEDYRELADKLSNPNTVDFVTNGVNQEAFFTELFAAREKYLPQSLDIEYIATDSPVLAFYRANEADKKLVLINFSGEQQTYEDGSGKLLYAHGASLAEDRVTLEPYGFAILQK